MKRILFLILVCSLLLCGCKDCIKEEKSEVASDVARIWEVLGGKDQFEEADADFIATSFEDRPYQERIVCFRREGFGEFGAFLLPSAAEAAAFEESVRHYLAREADAIRSIAALYPAEELEERLACYDEAKVLRQGAALYYVALPREEVDRALQAVAKS